ncbi:phosphomannomutase/phosphoglucomutase [Larsenimonas rhizosphaerae]|uniref:phosphomannomutase n=1 Tax=Larsenimonas rhizosphaerae TaxID=2944682 RepID=A0AA42CVI1_9GAMM|nr:phosphomannomutase/phosphoglucomutase [Larsenimonas rhizosphaerae]MCX2524991.1 phosphomannomutase/phosphoglucomutase [Larsenimonas rhizosphaerae]
MSQIPQSIFRAYDIRGVIDQDLTVAGARLIGQAIGSEVVAQGESRIVVARDGRLSGPDMLLALTEGLLSTGVDVIDLGRVPTPVLYFAVHTLEGVHSGVAVTGSHNPSNYNGFKIMIGGHTLSGEAIQGLYQRISDGRFSTGEGHCESHDIRDTYLERIRQDIHLKRPLKAVVDCGNGVGGELGPRLIASLGVDTVPLFDDIDGHFPNHHPDPGKVENLQDLIAMVQETGADIGLAFDGDADRVGVVTPRGEVIYPDRFLMALAEDLLTRKPGARVVFDIKCTGHLADMIARLGGEPDMWFTGHSLIKARMNEVGADLGGEMSGHIFFKERWYGFDDGIYAAARLLEILAGQSEDADTFFSRYPQDLGTAELNVEVTDATKFDLARRIALEGDFGNDGTRTTLDGLRVDYPDGWGLCRASNTTPMLVFRFEGASQAALDRIQDCFRTALLKVAPDATPGF